MNSNRESQNLITKDNLSNPSTIQLQEEIKSFQSIWQGGYYEGDPLDPLSRSNYGDLGYISILHATYLHCIRPYITPDTMVLEIGPGRGAWTKTMLGAKEVWCLDVKSREDNDIDRYLGYPDNLKYIQVSDFLCKELPDDTFDFLFSFGALCHVSWEGIVEYSHNIYPKLRSGAQGFFMIADYDKVNKLRENLWQYDAVGRINAGKWLRLFNYLDRRLGRRFGQHSIILDRLTSNQQLWLKWLLGFRLLGRPMLGIKDKNEDSVPRPGRWYHAGTAETVAMLEAAGYTVIDQDVGFNHRDPIIHFAKP